MCDSASDVVEFFIKLFCNVTYILQQEPAHFFFHSKKVKQLSEYCFLGGLFVFVLFLSFFF